MRICEGGEKTISLLQKPCRERLALMQAHTIFAPTNVHAIPATEDNCSAGFTRQIPRQQTSTVLRRLSWSQRVSRSTRSHDCYVSFPLVPDENRLAAPVQPSITAFSHLPYYNQSSCQRTNPAISLSLPSDTTERCCFPPSGMHLVTTINKHHTFSSRIQWIGWSRPPRFILGSHPPNSRSIGSRVDAMRP